MQAVCWLRTSRLAASTSQTWAGCCRYTHTKWFHLAQRGAFQPCTNYGDSPRSTCAGLSSTAAVSEELLHCTCCWCQSYNIQASLAPLQFDAPQEPDAFVHRCGRTARMGRKGSALAFLLPQETSYVDFLRLRRVRSPPLPPVDQMSPTCCGAEAPHMLGVAGDCRLGAAWAQRLCPSA